MSTELNNILITGATRGVGEALTLRFAQQGRKVLLWLARNNNSMPLFSVEAQE